MFTNIKNKDMFQISATEWERVQAKFEAQNQEILRLKSGSYFKELNNTILEQEKVIFALRHEVNKLLAHNNKLEATLKNERATTSLLLSTIKEADEILGRVSIPKRTVSSKDLGCNYDIRA